MTNKVAEIGYNEKHAEYEITFLLKDQMFFSFVVLSFHKMKKPRLREKRKVKSWLLCYVSYYNKSQKTLQDKTNFDFLKNFEKNG